MASSSSTDFEGPTTNGSAAPPPTPVVEIVEDDAEVAELIGVNEMADNVAATDGYVSASDSVHTAEIFTIAEVMPSFPGGQDKMMAFISKNVLYPELAREMGIEGTVYLRFVVEADGRITSIKVMRGVHKLLDDEAMRVIKAMPQWEPGTQRGKAVRTQMTIPVKFRLQ